MIIRPELPADRPRVEAITRAAFADHPHSDHREHLIVDALRAAGALTLSLVAERDGDLIAHIAFSRVSVSAGDGDWYGLGPLSVAPHFQRQGAGSALVQDGLARLRELGAAGCVVLGDPEYYRRFGFTKADPLYLPDFPPEYFSAVVFKPGDHAGAVAYDPAFAV